MQRVSVDLSNFPDLVVVYLGNRVSGLTSLKALFGIGPKLLAIQRDMPDGLLAHESIVFGLNHIGMRQYWRDLESLELFTRSDPHKALVDGLLEEHARCRVPARSLPTQRRDGSDLPEHAEAHRPRDFRRVSRAGRPLHEFAPAARRLKP